MKKHKFILIAFCILPAYTISISGQVPVIKLPQPSSISPGITVGSPDTNKPPTPNFPSFPSFNHNNPSQDTYERDRLEVERRNSALQQILDEDLARFNQIQYDLPSNAGAPGTEFYYQTAMELLDMLNGKKKLNLKEAVFSVENAYCEGRLNHTKYEKAIQELVAIAQLKSKQDGYNWNNPTTRNIMLFRVLSDTLRVKRPQYEHPVTSYPMQYDFDDFRGEADFSKLFVTKLLATHSGQCHSLPLLYLIMCESAGAEANLVFSPQHSYIKFKDQRNNWYNLELTQGRMVTDAFVIGSGFITAEAIKHGLYMEPQTKKQVIAHCLSDLAMGYARKYGYDDFVIQCADSVLKYAPGNISALATKSNYHTIYFEYTVSQVGYPPKDTLRTYYPRIYELMEERNNFYRKVDAMGYREMPREAYEHWMRSVNEEKAKREHDAKYNKVIQLIK